MTNISEQLQLRLVPEQLRFLQEAGATASRTGTSLYLVGGSVRDLMLGRPLLDIDVVAEGDIAALVARLAQEMAGEVGARSQFDTFKLKLTNGTVDVATARTETYSHPGALPTVKPGSVVDDLARRDFSINALAMHLSPAKFGHLVDGHNGERDLREKTVRVLHDMSFQDDGTRILRAIRYEQRLGFHMNTATEQLARRDAKYVELISADRMRREFDRCLQEEFPERCLQRADSLGVLPLIQHGLSWTDITSAKVQAARKAGTKLTSGIFWALLAWPLSQEQADALVKRLNLGNHTHKVVRDTQLLKAVLPWLGADDLSPSSTYALLKDRDPDAIQAALIACSEVNKARDRMKKFLEEQRHIKPGISADRLLAIGVPQGPLMGKLLEELLTYKLDHADATSTQEEALVRRRMRELQTEK